MGDSFLIRLILAAGFGVSSIAYAQTATLSLSSAAGTIGSPTVLNLTLSSSGSLNLSTLQFSLAFTAVDFSSITVAPGPIAVNRGKSITCNPTAGRVSCIVWGLNATALSDGVVATVTATPTTSSSN